MGWSWSKSVGVGPFRVNLSKSGVGFSVGGKGFRTGVNSKGRKYSTVSIPGTGIRYNTSGSSKKPATSSTGKTGPKTQTGGKSGCLGAVALTITMALVVGILFSRL